MAFFNSAVGVLQTLVIALGAGLGIWGVINLMEGYGNDNPGAKSQGMKQDRYYARPASHRPVRLITEEKPLNGHDISENHRVAERNAR